MIMSAPKMIEWVRCSTTTNLCIYLRSAIFTSIRTSPTTLRGDSVHEVTDISDIVGFIFNKSIVFRSITHVPAPVSNNAFNRSPPILISIIGTRHAKLVGGKTGHLHIWCICSKFASSVGLSIYFKYCTTLATTSHSSHRRFFGIGTAFATEADEPNTNLAGLWMFLSTVPATVVLGPGFFT